MSGIDPELARVVAQEEITGHEYSGLDHRGSCDGFGGQAKAKQALHAIWQAQARGHAEKAFDLF